MHVEQREIHPIQGPLVLQLLLSHPRDLLPGPATRKLQTITRLPPNQVRIPTLAGDLKAAGGTTSAARIRTTVVELLSSSSSGKLSHRPMVVPTMSSHLYLTRITNLATLYLRFNGSLMISSRLHQHLLLTIITLLQQLLLSHRPCLPMRLFSSLVLQLIQVLKSTEKLFQWALEPITTTSIHSLRTWEQ